MAESEECNQPLVMRETQGESFYKRSCVKSNSSISSASEEPRLRGVEEDVQDAKVVESFMPSQFLQGYDCGILEQVAKNNIDI